MHLYGRNLTDCLYTVTDHLQATHVMPINRLSDTVGSSFRQ